MSGAKSHRWHVLAELQSTERGYVERLRVAKEDYLNYIQSEDTVSAELKADTLPIFCNLPDIYTFHKNTFLPALEACDEDVEAITRCFITYRNKFSVYLPYCKNKPTSDTARAEHDDFFCQRRTALGQKLSIEDLLIAPVQRFTKYQLLLRDLLKDTQKAKEDTSIIQEALDLMTQIPKETNDIICVSLLRGIHRSRLVGHGSLWLQDTLLFWSNKNHGGVKAEPRQVFLFDHRILIALVANSDGFFDYQVDIKTLNSSVEAEIKGDALRFGVTTGSKETFFFQATSLKSKSDWISALNSILASQSQMIKALKYGKSAASKPAMHQEQAAADWCDSDSSVDSLGSKLSMSSGELDWTPHTSPESPKTKKNSLTTTSPPSFPHSPPQNSLTLPPAITYSASFSSTREFSKKYRSKLAATLTMSRALMTRWRPRRTSGSHEQALIPMPVIPSQRCAGFRSPGSAHQSSSSVLTMNPLLITKDSVPDTEPTVAGQLAAALHTSHRDQWEVHLLSGPNAGQDVSVQRQNVHEYNAPVSWLAISESHNLRKEAGSGRFSKVKKAKHRTTGAYHALKLLQEEVSDDAFHHELCIAYHLRHQNIVCCYGGIASGRERVITFELIKGKRLLYHLAHKSSATDADISGLVGQVLDALHYLHSRSICHLDCRPENVLVLSLSQGTEVVKLVDFGAARHFGLTRDDFPLEYSYESPVNYQHVPPEVLQHLPLGPAADIWAVGVMTFVIYHGHYPFAGPSEAATIRNISKGSYHIPNEGACSHHVRNFIRAALAQQCSERPTAIEAQSSKWFQKGLSTASWKIDLSHIKQLLSSE